MIQVIINGVKVAMGKFFSSDDKEAALEAIGDSKSVLFIDTPSTAHLTDLITTLLENDIKVQIRDHHNVLNPSNPREEQIAAAVQRNRELLKENALISDRKAHPACSLLIEKGEFADVEAIVADPDPDGLLASMKALGLFYDKLDDDAAVLDGARSEQTPENLSPMAMLLVKGLATLPPFNPKNPAIAEKAKGELFSTFLDATQGDAEAKCSLEKKVEVYEAGVAVAEELVSKATEPAPSLLLVDTVGSDRHDLMTLTRGLEAKGAKVTCIVKDSGPIATVHGAQYSLAVVKKFQSEIDLQTCLPEGFESSPAAGIISNTTFLLHVSENVWNDTVLPALKRMLG